MGEECEVLMSKVERNTFNPKVPQGAGGGQDSPTPPDLCL